MPEPIQLIGASWCGFTQKMEAKIDDSAHSDQFCMIDCGGADKGHEACKDVRGFPTFKAGDKTCHVGYSDDVGAIVTKCTPSSASAPVYLPH